MYRQHTAVEKRCSILLNCKCASRGAEISYRRKDLICCNIIKNESRAQFRRVFWERSPGVDPLNRRRYTVHKIVYKFKTRETVLDKKRIEDFTF